MCHGNKNGENEISSKNKRVHSMMRSIDMALFGLVWLLRVRSEMNRCSKCQSRQHTVHAPIVTAEVQATPSTSTFYLDPLPPVQASGSRSPGHSSGPTTYCEVHGYNPRKEGNISSAPAEVLRKHRFCQDNSGRFVS
ncbi:unnamed protein product [Brassicogethes aeneus]|uniref:Uncharacterized protein n=1 Tax=Brassicogethes aeneus TaxID=1431903 RepID=A0A9P0B9S7_BRAAE|nr:unnamed protein product [Brassicogethes aeneus]